MNVGKEWVLCSTVIQVGTKERIGEVNDLVCGGATNDEEDCAVFLGAKGIGAIGGFAGGEVIAELVEGHAQGIKALELDIALDFGENGG